jgi:hypothetical protein
MPIFDKLQGTQAESFIVNSRKKAGDDAALQVDSTDRGFLPPRMTTAQKTAIVAPRNGLTVWDSTLKCLSIYRDGVWYCLIDVGRSETWVGVTAGLSVGQLCYVSANITASPTDARTLAKSRCAGCYNGIAGRIQYDGVIDAMLFSAASSTPSPGDPVYVARADDEPLDAAAGKATADRPVYPAYQEEVGLVLSVNPITFPSTRVAKVLLQVKEIDETRVCGITLIGAIDKINQVFTTPTYFLHEIGGRSIQVYYNGQRLLDPDDYIPSESGGAGTGYDTITLQGAKPPRPGDKLWADYWQLS